ncbi:MAG: hypothetical protein A2036_04115 [Omnitrophica bacterium GWA2_50_21]|nr:MAG: hypothetical protein A2036_04115 [Omnitrophica bacterium GWA2_50_21]
MTGLFYFSKDPNLKPQHHIRFVNAFMVHTPAISPPDKFYGKPKVQDRAVDFVVCLGNKTVGIEEKSSSWILGCVLRSFIILEILSRRRQKNLLLYNSYLAVSGVELNTLWMFLGRKYPLVLPQSFGVNFFFLCHVL